MVYFVSKNGYARWDGVSLDRLRPENGYTRGNVVWASYFANTSKGALSLRRFIQFCRVVARRRYVRPDELVRRWERAIS